MKRKLYLFTGFGFIGLNILNYLKNDKFKLNIIGRKKKYPFKILINKKKFNFRFNRVSGAISSILGLKSFKRP